MKKLNTIILILLGMICTQLYAVQLNSIYPLKPNDSEAFYFSRELSYKGGWKDGCIGCFAGSD